MNERMDANTNSPFYHAARGLRKAKNDAGKLLISRHDWILTTDTYAPELNKRCRPHLKPTNKSYRTDETYIKVKGEDKYLYRAVDSSGQTIDFLLTAKRDASAAKRFFRKALRSPGNTVPRGDQRRQKPGLSGGCGSTESGRHAPQPRATPPVQVP